MKKITERHLLALAVSIDLVSVQFEGLENEGLAVEFKEVQGSLIELLDVLKKEQALQVDRSDKRRLNSAIKKILNKSK